MALNGKQLEDIQHAFENAFQTPIDLARMVRFKLDQNLNTIAGGNNLADIIYNLILWAETENKIETLLNSACEYKPNNQALQICIQRTLSIISGNSSIATETSTRLDSLLTQCKDFLDQQIYRYARSKYISGLYVRRDIQGDLDLFHSEESVITNDFRAAQLDKIEKLVRRVATATRQFQLIATDVSSLLSEADVTELEPLLKRLTALIKTLQVSLETLHSKYASIPSDSFLLNREAHQELKTTVEIAIASIKNTSVYQEELAERERFRKVLEEREKQRREAEQKARKAEKKASSDNSLPADRNPSCADIVLSKLEAIKRERFSSVALLNTKQGRAKARSLTQAIEGIKAFSISSIEEILASINLLIPEVERLQRNCVMIIDRAGGGKTSLLCEYSLKTVRLAPTLLLFGKENYSGRDSMVKKIEEILGGFFSPGVRSPVDYLDQVLSDKGLFLHVFVDGINECRKIPETETALLGFLDWASKHRIRVTMSCRDIYWEFFEAERWASYFYQTKERQLYNFSQVEYSEALQLYLRHYKITCKLEGNAAAACKHPLLLRFFCEAYGNIDGDIQTLGTLQDIRLKELFDVYLEKKMRQVQQFLSHKNADISTKFLLNLAEFMYKTRTPHVYTYDIETATGEVDTSTQDSVYLRLLDEDIIIEEEPSSHIDYRAVHFVYEEFMEYILAKAFLLRFHRHNDLTIPSLFQELVSAINDWANTRGVAEYFVLMLITSEEKNHKQMGYKLLELMLQEGGVWVHAFWSAVGKLPESSLSNRLYDFFYPALRATHARDKSMIKDALISMSRYSTKGAEKFASILLWSSLFPNILTWTDIDQIEAGNADIIDGVSKSLANTLANKKLEDQLRVVTPGTMLKWVLPYLDFQTAKRIQGTLSLRGHPRGGDFLGVMHILQEHFAKYHIYIINGLFAKNTEVSMYCADRIRFIKKNHKAVEIICGKLLQVEYRSNVSQVLRESLNLMDRLRDFSAARAKVEGEQVITEEPSGGLIDPQEFLRFNIYEANADELSIITKDIYIPNVLSGITEDLIPLFYRVVKPIKLRRDPLGTSITLCALRVNDVVEKLDQAKNWFQVKHVTSEGKTFIGWVLGKYLVLFE